MHKEKFKEPLSLEKFGSTINMQLNFNCNLKCFFCRGSMDNIHELSRTKSMTQNNFEIFINKITDYGISHLQLTQAIGEPFIDKGIIDKIKFLESNDKIKWYMITTNCTVLNEKHFEIIEKCKKLYLVASIYGYNSKTYEQSTGKNKFKSFYNNLKKLGDIFENKNNTSLLDFNIRCKDSYYNFPTYSLVKILIDKLIKNDNIQMSDSETENTNRGGLLKTYNKSSKKSGICPNGPGDGGGVLPNGDFLFCPFHDVNRVGIMGNLFKQTLKEIYSSDKWQELISNQSKNIYTGICADCDETF